MPDEFKTSMHSCAGVMSELFPHRPNTRRREIRARFREENLKLPIDTRLNRRQIENNVKREYYAHERHIYLSQPKG